MMEEKEEEKEREEGGSKEYETWDDKEEGWRR